MSWAEDEGIDGYDYAHGYPHGWDNENVWVDKDHKIVNIVLLETSHIKNILKGLKEGKSLFGQGHKEEVLKKILKMREGKL